ncbi:hypothetical protein GN244_ATG06182 [Phytophthora infestans]|nr:hypothetical protein GN244_ATG06182 [Phytophthora infestans]KAF4133681.1 hypothetical protein GN958_ATG17018 [Phytophthora infestans]
MNSRILTTTEKDEVRARIGLAPMKSKFARATEGTKLNVWLAMKNTPADAVAKLKLNRGVDEALAGPKLKALVSYVDMFSTKYPEKQVSVVGVLSTKYGEGAVAKGLVRATQATRSKDIATKLQTDQLHDWLKNKKTVKDVFTLLKIAEVDVHLYLPSGKLEALDEYIKLFNTMNPQHKTDLFSALRNGFGSEAEFAVVVSRALAISPWTSKEALKFQIRLFEQWIDRDIDPISIFTKVFKVQENNMASVTSTMKLDKDQYRPVYNKANGIKEPIAVDPRRF